jgi:hypothetical protein
MRKWLVVTALLMAASVATAQTPDPREHNFTFAVDGALIGGVVGYRIEFAPTPAADAGNRRLDLSYIPNQRVLYLTVTQKGLNQLQDWLNSTTDTQSPATHSVTITAKDNANSLLAQWQLTGVTLNTFSSAAAGNINEVNATIQFVFDRLSLVQARSK